MKTEPAVSLEEINPVIRQQVLGTGKLEGEELANAINSFILENVKKGRESAANVAKALFIAKKTQCYKHLGYDSWRDFTECMVRFNKLFGSIRQAYRYVQAVETWCIELGLPFDILEQVSPSILGEIAEAGVVTNKTEAEAWLKRLNTDGPAAARRELRRNKAVIFHTDSEKYFKRGDRHREPLWYLELPKP